MARPVHHPAIADHTQALCRILGLDPRLVRELRISAVAPLVAVMYDTNQAGDKYFDHKAGRLATYELTFEIRA